MIAVGIPTADALRSGFDAREPARKAENPSRRVPDLARTPASPRAGVGALRSRGKKTRSQGSFACTRGKTPCDRRCRAALIAPGVAGARLRGLRARRRTLRSGFFASRAPCRAVRVGRSGPRAASRTWRAGLSGLRARLRALRETQRAPAVKLPALRARPTASARSPGIAPPAGKRRSPRCPDAARPRRTARPGGGHGAPR